MSPAWMSASSAVDASCGSFTEQEYNTMIELGAKRSNVSQQERLLYQLLNDKWEKKVTTAECVLSIAFGVASIRSGSGLARSSASQRNFVEGSAALVGRSDLWLRRPTGGLPATAG
jgi:hypothetical protein